MLIERMSNDKLTRESWTFDLCRANSDGGPAWMCTRYMKHTRKKKTHKTWAQVAYMGSYPNYQSASAMRLDTAPIDDALIAQVRLVAAAAPVLGRRP